MNQEFTLHLPDRKPAKELLAKLDGESRNVFSSELLDALWDADEAGQLASSVARLIRDWVAHAHFEQSPVTQRRLARARSQQAITST